MVLRTVGVGITLRSLIVGRSNVGGSARLGVRLRLTSGLTVNGVLAVAGGGLGVVLEVLRNVVVGVVVGHDARELLLRSLLLVETGTSLVTLVLVWLVALVVAALLRSRLLLRLLALLRDLRLSLVIGSLAESVGCLVVRAVELSETLSVETAVHGRVVLEALLRLAVRLGLLRSLVLGKRVVSVVAMNLILLLRGGLLLRLSGETVRVIERVRLEAVVLRRSGLLGERVGLRLSDLSILSVSRRRSGSGSLRGSRSSFGLGLGGSSVVGGLGSVIGIVAEEVERAKLNAKLVELRRATSHDDGGILARALRGSLSTGAGSGLGEARWGDGRGVGRSICRGSGGSLSGRCRLDRGSLSSSGLRLLCDSGGFCASNGSSGGLSGGLSNGSDRGGLLDG